MRPDKQRQAFERYRAEGDVRALAQVFDAVAPELLQVARHLEGGGEAEDLVQSTFLVAIQRAGSYDAERPLLPWLLGILVNQAHLARRRRGRLVPIEEEGLLEGNAEDPAPQSQEFVAAVAAALRQLPDTYREVLVAHLREGKKPGQIAAELGRPPGTVRAQLYRGLRLLRAALPASFALGLLATLALPPALAGVRREVLRAARQRAGSSASRLIPSPGALRLCAGLLLVALGWWLWPERTLPARPEAPAGMLALPENARSPSLPEPLAREEREDARTTRRVARVDAQQTGSGRGELLVRVISAEGAPASAGIDLTLIPWGEPRWWAHVVHRTSDEHGAALFTDLAPGRSGVHADGGPQLRTTVEAGQRTELELRLPPRFALRGRVEDLGGAPLSGARVELFARATDDTPRRTLECGGDGRFVLEEVDPGQWVAAARPGWAASERVALERFQLRAAREEELVLRLEPAREALELELTDEDGAALPAASLEISVRETPPPFWRESGELARRVCRARARSDERGRARFEELPREELELCVRAAGRALFVRALAADERSSLRLVLARGATLAGRVEVQGIGGALAPGDGASVALEEEPERCAARADAQGRFVLAGLPAGSARVLVRAAGSGPALRARLELVAGQTLEWNARVAPECTIAGRVLGQDGRPVQTWLVRAAPLDSPAPAGDLLAATLEDNRDPALLRSWTDAQGRFRVPCGEAGAYRLELCPRGRWQRAPICALAPVESGAQEVSFEARTSPPVVHGTLLLPADGGSPFAEVFAVSPLASGSLRAEVDPGTGRYALEGSCPGEWRFYARRARGPLLFLGARTLDVRSSELPAWSWAEGQPLGARAGR